MSTAQTSGVNPPTFGVHNRAHVVAKQCLFYWYTDAMVLPMR